MNSQSPLINDEDRQRIEQAFRARRNEIASVDWDLINDEVGVLQAENQLRRALDQVLERLKAKDYQGVSQHGYGEVASGLIFLQRVMGGMQMNGLRRSSTISDIAGDAGLTYEQVAPFAEAAFEEAKAGRRQRSRDGVKLAGGECAVARIPPATNFASHLDCHSVTFRKSLE